MLNLITFPLRLAFAGLLLVAAMIGLLFLLPMVLALGACRRERERAGK